MIVADLSVISRRTKKKLDLVFNLIDLLQLSGGEAEGKCPK